MTDSIRRRSVLLHPVVLGLMLVALLTVLTLRLSAHRSVAFSLGIGSEHGEAVTPRLDSANPNLRLAAVEALAGRNDEATLATLEKTFEDSDAQVRIRSAEILTRSAPDRGLKLLLAALQDDDLWLRQDAAQRMALMIGRKGNPADRRIVPYLIRALDDHSDIVQIQAMYGLKKLAGNDWTASLRQPKSKRDAAVQRWKMWWKGAQGQYVLPAGFAVIAPRYPTRTDPAPRLSIRTIDGTRFHPFDPSGRLTLVNFWGTWCSPCRLEVPELQRIHAEFGSKGVDVVGVAMAERDGPDGLRAWCKKNKIAYPQALASDDLLRAYGDIDEVPISFLVDQKGQIRYRWEGERDYATFRAAIQRLLTAPS